MIQKKLQGAPSTIHPFSNSRVEARKVQPPAAWGRDRGDPGAAEVRARVARLPQWRALHRQLVRDLVVDWAAPAVDRDSDPESIPSTDSSTSS